MQYVMIFHANLNYAYLTPDRYEFVIRNAYEMTIDTMREVFPDTKYVFEASGYTIEQIAHYCPDVLAKLKQAIGNGQCEFMGSPYAHPMLANFPYEDGLWSIRFANEVYEKHLDIKPVSFWNPECGWCNYVPKQVLEAGYKNMIGDFEAYSRSCDENGQPLRPEIYEQEHSEEKNFYNFGFHYDLPGYEKAIHFPFNKISALQENQLRIFLRTDRVAQFGVRYFMGMQNYTFDKYLDLIRKYSEQASGEPEGALIIYADDAEYVGTNGWFRLKYQNKPDNIFEASPDARDKLIKLVTACKKIGRFITFDHACNKLPPLKETISFDEDSAWHGAQASTWADTPMAQLLRPWQDLVRQKLQSLTHKIPPYALRQIWFHLTSSYNSDGQWPPTLPDAPHIVHPFNYRYCFENLLQAELMAGSIDRTKLTISPAKTIKDILSPQQKLILDKANIMIKSGNSTEQYNACLAKNLVGNILTLMNNTRVLHPAEYTIRANALVAARKLVGGIEIEKCES